MSHHEQITRLEDFFNTIPIKVKEYKNEFMTVFDIPKFIETNLTRAKANPKGIMAGPCISRLQELERFNLPYLT